MKRKHDAVRDTHVRASTKRRAHALVAILSSGLAVVVTAACGAAVDDVALDTMEEVDVVGEAIGEASCATATADKTFTQQGVYGRAAPYSNAGCPSAVIVDFANYQAFAGPYAPVQTVVTATGIEPSTESACAAATLRADLYRRDNNAFTLIASDTVHGLWWFFGCMFGAIDETSRMSTGNDYRIAVSASRSSGGQDGLAVFSASTAPSTPTEPPAMPVAPPPWP